MGLLDYLNLNKKQKEHILTIITSLPFFLSPSCIHSRSKPCKNLLTIFPSNANFIPSLLPPFKPVNTHEVRKKKYTRKSPKKNPCETHFSHSSLPFLASLHTENTRLYHVSSSIFTPPRRRPTSTRLLPPTSTQTRLAKKKKFQNEKRYQETPNWKWGPFAVPTQVLFAAQVTFTICFFGFLCRCLILREGYSLEVYSSNYNSYSLLIHRFVHAVQIRSVIQFVHHAAAAILTVT